MAAWKLDELHRVPRPVASGMYADRFSTYSCKNCINSRRTYALVHTAQIRELGIFVSIVRPLLNHSERSEFSDIEDSGATF